MRIATTITTWLNTHRGRWLIVVYIGLLAASNVVQVFFHPTPFVETPPNATRGLIESPVFVGDAGERDDRTTVSYLDWDPDGAREIGPPVLLIHGSPGGANNFDRIGELLAASGRRAIAIDLPGFGASDKRVPDYSNRAHARYVLHLMDELGIERAHVLGFSMGGGVGLRMIERAPERLASLVMLASIGAQEAEGSGDYHFEHAKYAFGYVSLVIVAELVPHFGLIGERSFRHAWLRNFWDTDQRPLRGVMEQMDIPTLIIHGRDDILVPAWGAELHHDLIRTSSLVMLDTDHFIPFRDADSERVVGHVTPFLARHDRAGAAPLLYAADFAPVAGSYRTGVDLGPFHVLMTTPWWVVFLFIILATWISEDATVITVGVLIAHGQIDPGVGFLGCLVGIVLGDGGLWAIGRFAGRRVLRWPMVRGWAPEKSLDRWGRWFDQHTIQAVFVARSLPGLRIPTYVAAGLLSKKTHGFLLWAAIAAFVWTPILLVLAIVVGPKLLGSLERYLGGPLGIVASVLMIFIGVRVFSLSMTWVGRRKLARTARRLVSSEFWPRWALYAPLAPWLAYQSLRRGPMTFTCVNPDIPHGGGVIGESKHLILQGLLPHAEEWVARTHLIPAGADPESRAGTAIGLVEDDPELRGYPIVLKPDESQMGHGFKLARSREDVREYFQTMTRAALLQAFHPGPKEVGVLWARQLGRDGLDAGGRVVSVTRKEFPEIVGDGKSTLERLIWKHPRFRLQAEVFLKRHADKTDLVLPKGERMRLAIAGNHAQGTMFLDGRELITPELERRIDEIASGFATRPHPDGLGGFDYGRFDILYRSDEDLQRGENFVIVELNGTMSESTNMYDPRRSVLWTYGVLFSQWELLYRLGAARRRMGERPMGLGEVLATVRDHYRGRPGSPVAD